MKGINTVCLVLVSVVAIYAGTAEILVDEIQIAKNSDGVIPVKVKSQDPLAGIQFSLRFDPAQISVQEPEIAMDNTSIQISSRVTDNVLRALVFSFSGETIPAGGNTLITIPVKPAHNFSGKVDLEFEEFILASTEGEKIPFNKTSVDITVVENLPKTFKLDQNYPNPFNPTTMIHYEIPKESNVSLTIYNLLGQEVRNLVNGSYRPGFYSAEWDGRDNIGRDVASGEYICTFRAGSYSKSMKMVFLK